MTSCRRTRTRRSAWLAFGFVALAAFSVSAQPEASFSVQSVRHVSNFFCLFDQRVLQVQPEPTPPEFSVHDIHETHVSLCTLTLSVGFESKVSLTASLQTPQRALADVKQATEGLIPVR